MEDKDLLLDEKLAHFYDQMGYAEVEMYNEPEYDLMNYKGKSKYITKFNLKESDIDAIMLAIKQSAAYQRASQKSMTTTLSRSAHEPDSNNLDGGDKNTEALLQTRRSSYG